jgi:hypothetical protein
MNAPIFAYDARLDEMDRPIEKDVDSSVEEAAEDMIKVCMYTGI